VKFRELAGSPNRAEREVEKPNTVAFCTCVYIDIHMYICIYIYIRKESQRVCVLCSVPNICEIYYIYIHMYIYIYKFVHMYVYVW